MLKQPLEVRNVYYGVQPDDVRYAIIEWLASNERKTLRIEDLDSLVESIPDFQTGE